LVQNVEALDIALSEAQVRELESVLPFDPGFPHTMIGDGTTTNAMMIAATQFDKVPLLQAIRPEA